MSSTTKARLDALEATMQALVGRAHLHKARRAPDFVPALLELTRVGPDAYLLDLDALEEPELYSLAGGEAFEAWYQGLDTHEQIALARGELPPWRWETRPDA